MTGAGMMDCKKALVEADGDFDLAIEILRKKGQKVSASRSDRAANEGSVFVKTSESANVAVLIALNCETDFVAKNEEFQALGEEIVNKAFDENPDSLDSLLGISLGELTIGEKVTEMIGKIGEKIEISAYERIEGEAVVSYIHAGSKLGVLVALEGVNGSDANAVGRDVAMQIAAMNPVAIDKDDVDETIVQKELEIGRQQALEEGKPENIVDKIAEGKLNKYFKDNTLLNQQFVKDNSQTVAKYLESISKDLKVARFKRISVAG